MRRGNGFKYVVVGIALLAMVVFFAFLSEPSFGFDKVKGSKRASTGTIKAKESSDLGEEKLEGVKEGKATMRLEGLGQPVKSGQPDPKAAAAPETPPTPPEPPDRPSTAIDQGKIRVIGDPGRPDAVIGDSGSPTQIIGDSGRQGEAGIIGDCGRPTDQRPPNPGPPPPPPDDSR